MYTCMHHKQDTELLVIKFTLKIISLKLLLITALKSRDHLSNVLLQNVVLDYVKHEFYIFCVSGTGKVWVDVC